MHPGKVHIIHHHLHPGGVTQIIESQVKSLTRTYPDLQIKILCGHPGPNERFDQENVQVIVNPNLDYLYDENPSAAEIDRITRDIKNFLYQHIAPNEIIHVHNINLGKNPLLTWCIYQLAGEGRPVLNHAHDFAEDRPPNMAFLRFILRDGLQVEPEQVMYPVEWNNYHIGVINTFDQERLIKQDFPAQRVSYLPNPVSVPDISSLPPKQTCRANIIDALSLDPDRQIVTYPVRVIRRKNIGELILLSELLREQAAFLVTLAPKNPVEIEHYKNWTAFCMEKNLDNIHFEVGEIVNYPELVRGSDFCITTSIREGFGMTYMEPWLYETPVVGRDIDYITRDFYQSGIAFPGLYQKIEIPDLQSDFKDLDIKDQMYEILRIKHEPQHKKKILSANKNLISLLDETNDHIINTNIQQIVQHYSLKSYGKKIMDIYQKLSGSPE